MDAVGGGVNDVIGRGGDLGEDTGYWSRVGDEEDKRLTALLEGVFTKEKWSLSPKDTVLSMNS